MCKNPKKISTRAFGGLIVVLLLNILLAGSPLCAVQEKLSADAFDDPEYELNMPAEWLRQEIVYDETVTNADLVVNLDQSEYGMFEPIIKSYAQKNKLKIFVNSGTCGISNRNLLNRQIDIGSFCCPPEKADRFPGLRFHTIGLAPLALIVHPSNPINDISFEEAQKIFMGEIVRWSELKNAKVAITPGQLIQPVAFIHCKKRPGHWRLLLHDEELFSVRTMNVIGVPEMVYKVANTKLAIGYETLWLGLNHYKDRGEVKALKLNGIDPGNLKFLLQNQYPIYRTFNLTTWEDSIAKKKEAGALVKYLLEYMDVHGEEYSVVSSKRLRQAGWKFKDNEVIAAPD